jgi:hypothetical protein
MNRSSQRNSYRFNRPELAPHFSRLSRNKINKTQRFKIATWNCQGKLKETDQCDQLLMDLAKRDVAIAALQETKAQDILHVNNKLGYTIFG